MPHKHEDITLRVSDHGKIWPMSFSFNKRNALLSCGWREFVQDNAHNVGDACFFKINKNNRLSWNLTVFCC